MDKQKAIEDDSQQSYSYLKESNCIRLAWESSRIFHNTISTIKRQKTLTSKKNNMVQIQINIESQNEIYESWKKIYQDNIKQGRKNSFEYSIFKIFRQQLYFALFIELFGYLCHCLTPLVLYFVYQNIVNNTSHTRYNHLLVISIVVCRIIRIISGYYSQIMLNEVGLKMYKLASVSIVNKTLKCSILSNKNISATGLQKMMHSDCENLLLYPSKIAFAIENISAQFILSAIIIYVAGIPGFIGIVVLSTYLLLRMFFKSLISNAQKELNILTSQRIHATIQTFNIIKYIKANALESCYFNKLRQLRITQVIQLKVKLFMEMIQYTAMNITKPLVNVLVTELVILRSGTFDIQTLFTVNICLLIINQQVILNTMTYVDMIQTSLKNIQNFMQQAQLNLSHLTYVNEPSSKYSIQVFDGNFKWNCDQRENKAQDNSKNNLNNINIKIQKGEIVAIIGGYGTGKSSLVNCLLGQMDRLSDSKITINGSIAYAGQVPWIISDTIRNNILFGKPFDQKKYFQVLKYAALQADLPLFPNRDLSMIGKRGSTLSGGQRARVSFARALYSDADIYILDDILSAVDAHVGSFLFFMGIKQYLANKTVLLITHSLYYVQHTDRILVFDKGQIISEGTYLSLKSSPIFHKVESTALKTSKQFEHALSTNIDLTSVKVLQIAQDLESEISISQSFKVYIQRNSGIAFVVIMTLFIFIIGGVTTYANICLNSWALSPGNQGNYFFYISLLLNGLKAVLTLLMAIVLQKSKMYQSIHDDMIRSLLFSPYSYFEKVPSSTIINRLSKDMQMNDKIITSDFGYLLVYLQLFLSYFLGILFVYFTFKSYYFFIVFSLAVLLAYYQFNDYFSLSLSIHRLQQQLILPINSKFSQIVDGLSTIRAYKKLSTITKDFWNTMGAFAVATTVRYIIDAKLKLILLSYSNLLVIITIISIVFFDASFSTYTIFIIFNFLALQDTFIKFYGGLAAFAPRLQSLGRLEQLTKLQPQKGYINYLSEKWIEEEQFKNIYYQRQIFPKGVIIFDQFCLRYKPELQDVLQNLSFVVKPGEKIGIVGRTGSGKSTTMLGLLRIIEASSGRIMIDGIDISVLSLQELRSNINIILQDHFLFTGTVKDNVDPTHSHTDQQVILALKHCGIWEQFEQREGVNTAITEGGDNLSSGEKQLINIARSLLNPKRIVLIDQATASIDLQTDSMIQKVMKRQFADKTVLTIAHRINTVIDSDRILVLDKGKIAEFDSPTNLLRNQNSIFAKLYKQSGKLQEKIQINS